MKNQEENTTQDAPPPGDAVVTEENAFDTEAFARLQTENEELKATIRLGEARRQITGELAKAGARSPGLLFESVKGDLQFADDGTFENGGALVERLKKGFPEQFGPDRTTSSIDAGAGRVSAPALTKEALAKMKPAEIAALDWAEVKQILREK